MRVRLLLISIAVFISTAPVLADGLNQKVEVLSFAGSCRFIEQAAYSNEVSIEVLTRLIWTESRFQADAISPAGAQGISQFMPATAAERGLSDAFDPRLAIPEAARFLADLDRTFGNVGLAVAAYNAGPGRISKWLSSNGTLPRETAAFVVAVTGMRAEDWAALGPEIPQAPNAPQSCMTLKATLRDSGFSLGAAFSDLTHGAPRENIYMLPILKNSGRTQPRIERSGDVLPSMRHSGQALPSLSQSGRMLAPTVESARALSEPTGKADTLNRPQPSAYNHRNAARSTLYRVACGACSDSRQ